MNNPEKAERLCIVRRLPAAGMVNRRGYRSAPAGLSGRHVGTADKRNSGDLASRREAALRATGPYKAASRRRARAASGVGGAHSSDEAGQCPWSEGALVVSCLKWREARRRW
jgi:hypothetical protein